MFKALSLAALAALACATPALAADVTITLTGVQARGGSLLVSLQTRDQFMQPAAAHGDIIASPTAGTRKVVLRDVAPGDYAVMVLHDADNDGQMTMNGGMPGEGWAMINGEALRATPRFEQVKFTVPASGKVDLTIPMSYPR